MMYRISTYLYLFASLYMGTKYGAAYGLLQSRNRDHVTTQLAVDGMTGSCGVDP